MDFETVLRNELEEIALRRSRRETSPEAQAGGTGADGPRLVLDAIRERIAKEPHVDPDAPRDLTGIAISGGGIRSATFALGVLQALSERRLFERADYLSTVSGGGYIGSCLSSMFANGERRFPFRPGAGRLEQAPVKHLRRYSNYLLPRGPIDVLRMPGVLLRGILSTGIAVLPWLMAAVIILVLVAGARISDALVNGTAAVVDVSMSLDARGQPDYAFSIRRAMVRRPNPGSESRMSCAGDPEHVWSPATNRVVETFAEVVEHIPCTRGDFVVYGLPEGTLLHTVCAAREVGPDAYRETTSEPGIRSCSACAAEAVHTAVGEWVCLRPEPADVRQLDDGGWYLAREPAPLVRASFPVASREGFTLTVKQRSKTVESEEERLSWQPSSIWDGSFRFTLLTLAATGIALALFPLASRLASALPDRSAAPLRRAASNVYPALFVALVAVAFAEAQPIAAYHFTATWSWLTASAAFTNVDNLVYVLLGLGVATCAWILRPSQATEQSSGRGKLFLIGLVGPVGLWLLALLLTHWTLCRPPDAVYSVIEAHDLPERIHEWLVPLIGEGPTRAIGFPAGEFEGRVSPSMCFGPAQNPVDGASADSPGEALPLPSGAYVALHVYAVVALLALLYNLLCLNVNHTSLHRYYRDRLSAAYLFKRGSKGDDVVANDAQTLDGLGAEECIGPYHLINGALNFSRGARASESSDAGGGERPGQRVDHFLFSMLAIGSDQTGYCDARRMRRADRHVNLGTAMAISGAAASPRMGELTVSTLAMLMVLLNVRLGYWVPNPGRVEGRKSPWPLLRLPGPWYLLREMSGRMPLRLPFVNVSDGGHIENLGLFALIRRRCRLIVSIDGERDSPTGDHSFAGLATAIRMARIVLGVEIQIDVNRVGAPGEPHFAVGRIRYGGVHPDGWLIYLKLSYSGDENPYVREYRRRDPQFPHQSTGDQFFDEAQFEAYRALGQHVAETFLRARVEQLADGEHLAELRAPGQRGGPAGPRAEATVPG